MLAEHIFYSTAIAIIVGMFWFRFTGRDYSWIIILFSWAPDLDKITDGILNRFRFTLLFQNHTIHHGSFHNIAMMVIFGIIIAFLLNPFGIRFFDGLFLAIIGFGSHLFEDALVYPVDYMYFWPFSTEKMGLGWLPMGLDEESYTSTFFHIANTEVLIIGVILLISAFLVRTWYEGSCSWIRWYMPDTLYREYFQKKNESS